MSTEDRRDPTRLVRPYAVTGGRTRPAFNAEELELETLVSTTTLGEAAAAALSLERRAIAMLCREVLSIVEIAAHLDIPIGVARVLVGDMAHEGLLSLHRPTSPTDRPDLALLERVLYGLRTI
jgi:DNA-directed RNA polymerase specialized sigma24 family protein